MEEAAKELPCADKAAYDSPQMANGAATVADWQHGARLKSYRCKYCKRWHLASTYKS